MPFEGGIPGLGSGLDTQNIIKKLVEIESRPIKRIENQIKRRQYETEAWNKVQELLEKINAAIKTLYSFNAPFGLKIADSDSPKHIKVEANKYAELMSHKIKILQLASKHKIASDALTKKYKIPKGEFTFIINKKKKRIYFNGGDIQSLFNLLSKKADKIISSSIVNTDRKNFIITIESKTSGRDSSIEIEDPTGVLKDIGIKKIYTSGNKSFSLNFRDILDAGNNNSYYNIGDGGMGQNFFLWNDALLEKYNTEGTLEFPNLDSKDKKEKSIYLTLKGKAHLGFRVKNFIVDEGTRLLLSFRPEQIKEKPRLKKAPSLSLGSQVIEKIGERKVQISKKDKLDIGGTILKGHDLVRKEQDFDMLREYQLGQTLEKRSKKLKKKVMQIPESDKRVKGSLRLIFDDGSHKDIFYNSPPKSSINDSKDKWLQVKEDLFPFIGKTVRSIEINNESGVVSIRNIILEPAKKGSVHRYKNEIARAKDAVLTFGGVKLYRPTNKRLTDIIKGLTISLLKPSEKDIIITVNVDTEKPQKAIGKFMTAYNEFLDLAARLQEVSKEKEAGNFKRQKEKSGLLVGDSTLMRLVSDLKRISSNAYPNDEKKAIKILHQIGISTGKLRQTFDEIRKGHLKIIDNDVLEDQLINNYTAVKLFFGSDSTGDRRINEGMAYKMHIYIRNYTQSGRYGLIAAKLQLTEDRIKQLNKNKENRERHVENYRQKLRRSFTAMEKGMMRSKNEQRWLGNQIKGMSGGGNNK